MTDCRCGEPAFLNSSTCLDCNDKPRAVAPVVVLPALMRWSHIANSHDIVVLFTDGARTCRAVVTPDHDIDGTTLVYAAGDVLPEELHAAVIEDMTFAEAQSVCAPKPTYYAGVVEVRRAS